MKSWELEIEFLCEDSWKNVHDESASFGDERKLSFSITQCCPRNGQSWWSCKARSTRQVYNLCQDLWNKFLGFFPTGLKRDDFKKLKTVKNGAKCRPFNMRRLWQPQNYYQTSGNRHHRSIAVQPVKSVETVLNYLVVLEW